MLIKYANIHRCEKTIKESYSDLKKHNIPATITTSITEKRGKLLIISIM
jgi:hypothetical protein